MSWLATIQFKSPHTATDNKCILCRADVPPDDLNGHDGTDNGLTTSSGVADGHHTGIYPPPSL
jgi:hypothetical protein